MIKGEDIVAEAQTWIGTPFHHGGRVKNVGADCLGIIVGVAKSLGLAHKDRAAYPLRANGTLQPELDRQLLRIPISDRMPGDILLMTFDNQPHHVAFFCGEFIIHAFAEIHTRRCLSQPFDDYWLSKTVAVYRFNEVDNG